MSVTSILARENTVARPGFNRWLVPPAALAIHLCIGMAYGFSVFTVPLGRVVAAAQGAPKPLLCHGDSAAFTGKLAITGHALFATDCDWTQFDLGWMFTLFFVALGISAALWGGWVERNGPRKTGVVSALLWCGGLLLAALGARLHQLWLMWLGAGLIGGIGLGLGYISPVSTLIKWFPDRRGMATGMAIMGFGGGALVGTPLANLLINHFKTASTVGVWQTLVVMALVYFAFMMAGAFGYRVPPEGWVPDGWTSPNDRAHAMIATGSVHLENAHRTPQFWLIWLVLCMNVSAGIGVIGAASPMLQDAFGGQLFGAPSVPFEKFSDAQRSLAAGVGTAFVGLFSLFNIAGRFFWASLSDRLGRKNTYYVFFLLGVACYAALTPLSNAGMIGVFAALTCVIASMYGGSFATVPAYLADMFGTQFVGAIHGRLLTAWSTAGILGPVLVNYLHDSRLARGSTHAHVYDAIYYVLVGMLLIGLLANASVRPVAREWFMSDAELARVLAERRASDQALTKGSYGIGRGGLTFGALLAWAAVVLPLAWGTYMTLMKARILYH